MEIIRDQEMDMVGQFFVLFWSSDNVQDSIGEIVKQERDDPTLLYFLNNICCE